MAITKSNIITLTICIFLMNLISLDFSAQKYGFERVDSVTVTVGGVQLNYPWVGGINAAQFSTIHLNNDTIEDLFIFDRTGNKVLTFINSGIGSGYVYAPEYENQFPALKSWALLRDYNCDGKKDIFSYVSGGIGVWENTSSGGGVSFVNVSDNGTTPYVISNQYGNYVNLYVSKSDIPDINDIDGDGDLDVLTFGVIGSRVEYHKNLSVEEGYGCDSLYYELKNECWGHFMETGFGTNTAILFDTCSVGISDPQKEGEVLKHAGSTILSLDLNDDGVKDLILGDVSFKNLVALTNDNLGVNMNTSFLSQDTAFPSNTVSVDMQIFPGSFYEDMDNDGVKDLIVSPNSDNETENHESVWRYKNFGTNTLPIFGHMQNNFLQDDMIEKGRSAFPVLFDYNNDGLTDLFVSNFGIFDMSAPDNYRSQMALYQNVGSITFPEFQLVSDDFQGLSGLGLGKGIYPTFSDMDNDGDVDMICGTHDGYIHYFMNTSGSLNSMNFVLMAPQLQDDNSIPIDVGYAAKPYLFDIDNDLDYDLIIGEENGNLNYYENIGSQSSYVFRFRTETFGDIDVSEWWTTIGNSIPVLFKDTMNETQMFVGTENGAVFHYDNIESNLTGAFNVVDTLVANINIGPNAAPAIGDLNGDSFPDMIAGTKRGGVSLYMGNPNFISTFEELVAENIFKAYPNPTTGLLSVVNPYNSSINYNIYSSIGQLVQSGEIENLLDMSNLNSGLYLVIFEKEEVKEVLRVIKN